MATHKYALAVINGKIYPLPIIKVEKNGDIVSGDYILTQKDKNYGRQYPDPFTIEHHPYLLKDYPTPHNIVFANYIPVVGGPVEKVVLEDPNLHELNIENILDHGDLALLNELYQHGERPPPRFSMKDISERTNVLEIVKWMIERGSFPDHNYDNLGYYYPELIPSIDALIIPYMDNIRDEYRRGNKLYSEVGELYWYLIEKYKLVPSTTIVDFILKDDEDDGFRMLKEAFEAKGIPSQEGVNWVATNGSDDLKKWLFGNLWFYQNK